MMLPHHNNLLGFIISCFLSLPNAIATEAFNLTILHVNDIHVRFEQTNKYSGICKPKDEEAGECYGGIARLKKTVDDLTNEIENVIFINGGDFYQGNVWYTHFKWQVVAHFAKLLKFTAMVPGNHEFDDNVDGFLPFLEDIGNSFPIVCANFDLSDVPILEQYIQKSVTIQRSGRKIGIIGYLTTETANIANPGKVKFFDEVTSVNEEAKRLKAKGVDIIIALGHAGFRKDQVIAANVPDVDVVVGGHSNTFLYTGGKPPSREEPAGPYPFMVSQTNNGGKRVPVVQAYAYTKYLGKLDLSFDENGDLMEAGGNPILLSQDMPQDKEILRELEPWQRNITELSEKVIGTSTVFLRHSRSSESLLGDFITDSMVNHFAKGSDDAWTTVSIAMINSGGIRGELDMGDITYADMLTILPFQNTIDVLTLKGETIRKTLELGASQLDENGFNDEGGFIQVSGIKFTIDLSMPKRQRITEIKVACADCPSSTYEDLDDFKVYKVAAPTFLANGGDDNVYLKNEKLGHDSFNLLDTDAFIAYLRLKSPVQQELEGRIKIISSGSSSEATLSTILDLATYLLPLALSLF